MNYELEIYRMRHEWKHSVSVEWRWRITAHNRRVVGASTEGYSSRAHCLKNIYAVTGWNIKLRKEEKRSARIERVVIREKA